MANAVLIFHDLAIDSGPTADRPNAQNIKKKSIHFPRHHSPNEYFQSFACEHSAGSKESYQY